MFFFFQGFGAIHYCVLHGNIEGVTELIKRGADINLRDRRSGRTALFHAIELNNMELAQLLLDNDAEASIPSFSGATIMSIVDEGKLSIPAPK